MEASENAASVALYQYLYRHIVGSEENVKTIRLVNTIRDNASTNIFRTYITSRSFGEGLEMKGSDLDIMIVLNDINVHETSNTYPGTRFIMDTDETKPGFTRLRLMQTKNLLLFSWCVELSSKRNLYLSNSNFKAGFLKGFEFFQSVHGPCLSDKDQKFDLAICLHSKLWISQARQWVIRSNNSWPSETVKQAIVDHGVLFVPVGMKGSPNEEVEWRISFSVGEKFLIYTFSHTQMMCYALMKILLKEVIEVDSRSKNLLCSYFLKTILFWVSEETVLKWSPNNLNHYHCFMQCFRRLIYCVKYSLCPHYFIPENNLFENKIEGTDREILLENLTILYSYGWRCILFSNQVSTFRIESARMYSVNKATSLTHLLERLSLLALLNSNCSKDYQYTLKQICSYESSRLKYLGICILSIVCNNASQSVLVNNTSGNKDQYKKYRTCLSYILQNMGRDAVSRWLLLSSLFYRMKQYGKCLHILAYTLSKCTPEKIYTPEDKLGELQSNILNSNIFKNEFAFVKYMNLRYVTFRRHSPLIPNELEKEVSDRDHLIPPVVYAHFLRILCFYHLKNVQECIDVLGKLLSTIKNMNFIAGRTDVASSFNCAGIVFQLLGDYEIARKNYMAAVKCDSSSNCSLQRLLLLND